MTEWSLDARQIDFLTRFLGLCLPSVGTDAADLDAAVEGYLSTLPADIKALARSNPVLAESLLEEVARARALREEGGLADALLGLEACAERLAEAKGAARAAQAAEDIPEGLVKTRVRAIELALSEWRVGRLEAIDGLGALVSELMLEDDPDLVEIGTKIAALGRDIPNALEAALREVRRAVGAGDEGQIAQARATAEQALAEAARYIKDNAADLRKCEDNPYGIEVDAVAAVSDAIGAVEQSLQKV